MNKEEAGMIHIYTGEGKGKTTAAIGLAIRAAGSGKKVVLLQFLKGSYTSELEILNQIEQIKVMRLSKAYPFLRDMTAEDKAAMTAEQNELLQKALKMVEDGECDVLILDEIMAAYQHHTVDKQLVHYFVEQKPYGLELVMPGRNAREYFIEKADYVTEMLKKKHPFDAGYGARKGIEY